jgi:hypothetical protein
VRNIPSSDFIDDDELRPCKAEIEVFQKPFESTLVDSVANGGRDCRVDMGQDSVTTAEADEPEPFSQADDYSLLAAQGWRL